MGALRANGYQAVLACQRRRQLCWTKPYARGGVALVQHAKCVPTRELESDCGMGAQQLFRRITDSYELSHVDAQVHDHAFLCCRYSDVGLSLV